MKIIVLGGDGFCGWPTALKLLSEGHQVLIVDNLSRRSIDHELSSNSLIKISSVQDRITCAKNLLGDVSFAKIDIAREPERIRECIKSFAPSAIVHFAEQRAAPYSMIGDIERRYTVDNNISGTHNLLSAIVDINPEIHLIHLGTMGVYGYSKDFGAIPEGYLPVKILSTDVNKDILYPANPGSVYHMTKCLDQLMFQFYSKNWGLRITDLHQGIVWGTQTPQTSLDPHLTNRFDYDGIYGTVLNRFLVQAVKGFNLSVYGTGGQTRAFIHIEDTTNCISLAASQPPKESAGVRIFNQIAETQSVLGLAQMISRKFDVSIDFLPNPRKELAENELEVSNEGLRSLGFKPKLLDDKLLEDTALIAANMSTEIHEANINNSPNW